MSTRHGRSWRAVRGLSRVLTVLAWSALILLFGSSAASWAADPPLPAHGGVATDWTCVEVAPIAADPLADPPVEAAPGSSTCSVDDWEPWPAPEPYPTPEPAAAAGPDAEAIVEAIGAESARNRVVGTFAAGLLIFGVTAAFFRSGGR